MAVSEKPLHIDIPVKLNDVKSVFSIGALAGWLRTAWPWQGFARCSIAPTARPSALP
jgi:hypothetical protein